MARLSIRLSATTQVADQVLSEVKKLGDVGVGVPFFDPLAFRQVTEVRCGNVGRNSLRGPGFGSRGFRPLPRFPHVGRCRD